MEAKVLHIPVLLNESIEALGVRKGGRYIDCTLGAGGHSEEILKHGGEVLGIEADSFMLNLSKERLEKFCPTLLQGNFSDIFKIAKGSRFDSVDGVLFDLGVSTYHYETLGRGFSTQKGDEPLDMRLEPEKSAITASELLNVLPSDKLEQLFEVVLERHKARRVVRLIVSKRIGHRFESVSDLRDVLRSDLPEAFLALRMAVNDEANAIERGLKGAVSLLDSGGRLVVISFHSGEDRLVFRLMKSFESEGLGVLVTKKPIVPSERELSDNPRSRSALMRVFKKNIT